MGTPRESIHFVRMEEVHNSNKSSKFPLPKHGVCWNKETNFAHIFKPSQAASLGVSGPLWLREGKLRPLIPPWPHPAHCDLESLHLSEPQFPVL